MRPGVGETEEVTGTHPKSIMERNVIMNLRMVTVDIVVPSVVPTVCQRIEAGGRFARGDHPARGEGYDFGKELDKVVEELRATYGG